jgi:hypothetical protein
MGSLPMRDPFFSSQLHRLSSSNGSTGSRHFKNRVTLLNNSLDCRRLGDASRIKPGS